MSVRRKVFDYEVAVIGGGSGGFAAARAAAAAGLKTAVIEGGKEVGGLCILRGCMPTKALLYAAEVMHRVNHPQTWGVRADDAGFNFTEVMARKDALIKGFADYRTQQLNNGKFEFIRAMASFKDEHTLALSDGKTLTAKNFVIATGSRISPAPLPQLDRVGYLTSDSALKLERLPKSLIVLGGGAVGVEFGQFFVRFGVQTTLIQRSAHILHEFDEDAADCLETALRREGIKLFTGTKLLDARRTGSEKEITFEHAGKTMTVRAEEIFYALGRKPNFEKLGLEKLRLRPEYGCLATNPRMQTSSPHIFAAGDCTGRNEIVHIAIQQGETAAFNISNPKQMKSMDYRLLAEVIFTEPQIATVGLTEKNARGSKISYLTASYPFNDHGKSMIMDALDGFVKLLADPATGEILGGCCAGPSGGELIHEIIAAMYKRMTVRELASMPHYHPTLAEIWTYPAEELADKIDRIKIAKRSKKR